MWLDYIKKRWVCPICYRGNSRIYNDVITVATKTRI